MVIVAMLVKGIQRRDENGPKIEYQIIGDPARSEKLLEISFKSRTKTIQNQHVNYKMGPVCMEESMQDQPPILLSVNDLIGIELVFIDQAMLTEGNYRENGSYYDNGKS
jgi:hypothetical protein